MTGPRLEGGADVFGEPADRERIIVNRSIIVTAVVLAMNGTLGATARADQQAVPQQAQHSTVLGHRVLSITPRVVEEINGKRTRHLTGADIRIEAEPGMTAEYLTVALRHMREGAGQATTESVFGVEGSAVEVRSTGDGFVFPVTAPDPKRAEEIVRRARLLV